MRLFWKFFLSFWVALVLFSAASVLTASQFLERMRERREATTPHQYMMRHVAEAQAAADRGGIKELRSWARRVDRREAVPILVLNPEGEDALAREVPTWILERHARRAERPPPSRDHSTSRLRPVISLPDGTQYRLVPDFQGVTLARVLRRPWVMAVPLLVAALVSGLVCFALARYLTAPIQRLHRATEGYAAGDLSQRVGPSLGGRRDELAELGRAFDRMAERLNTVIGSQKRLLSDVSHELRSPLARLQVALGLARQRAGEHAQPELDRMERETELLNELIGQLLSLARLESGAEPPLREPVDVAELLEAVAADAAFEAHARSREVRLEKTARAVIAGNPSLLHSALENVLRNAVSYTDEGSTVELSMERDPVQSGRLVIRVRDHGPGVPGEMLSRLFEPFVRAGDARDRATGGYGLGLAIADRAVRLHGGEMSARNEPDGGFSVLIYLPLEQTPRSEDRTAA